MEKNETGAAPFAAVRGESINLGKIELWPQQRTVQQRLSEELPIVLAGDKEPQPVLNTAQQFINTVLSQDA